MNRAAQIIVGTVAVVVIGVCLTFMGGVRVNRARVFGEPHTAATHAGTNYVLRLNEVTVGKTKTGHVLIVYLTLENPHETALVLDRDWFVLVDPHRNYVQPSTTGTQTQLITVPPRGVSSNEMLSFVLDDHALEGGMMLKIGKDAWAYVKSARPFAGKLEEGMYRTFRTKDW